MEQPLFLPMSLEEARGLGLEQLDVILVSGDAYVDHPAFGVAIVGRVLWEAGFAVGIIAQPDWRQKEDLQSLGTPRLFFGISAGNVDSMVNAFTPNLKRRRTDVYSPGGRPRRPDRASIVYAQGLHSLFPKVPLILGGLEASLRRFAHYDYWSDSVRGSILADAPGDIVVFGMAETALRMVASRLDSGEDVEEIEDVPGTAVKMEVKEWRNSPEEDWVEIPGFPLVARDKIAYAQAFKLHYLEQDPFQGRKVVQPHPKTVVVQNPPSRPLTSEEMDSIYELPFSRDSHPSYRGEIPALEPVRFSVTSHRGCFGDCHFCALSHHQGRIIQSRSIESLVREVQRLTHHPHFKGVIQDVGGPTANMYGSSCALWNRGACRDRSCINCSHLDRGWEKYLEVLRRLREIPGVKHVFVSSGLRHDLLLEESPDDLTQFCRHHVSGHLKIAPEHVSTRVTACMNKPSGEVLDSFLQRFELVRKSLGRQMYVLPYLMSGHPGCTVDDMIELAEYMRDRRVYPEQVQDFTPTPMTVSTAMYHTGLNPLTGDEVHVPRGREKRIQRAILQYRDPRNYNLVRQGLEMVGRQDLIGYGPKCLIPPQRP